LEDSLQRQRPAILLAAMAVLPAVPGISALAPADPEQGGRPLSAALSGAAEVQPGDQDGSGTAAVTVNPGQGELCYDLAVAGIDPATAAHVHEGVEGEVGPPVVTLGVPDASGAATGCLNLSKELLQRLLHEPSGFYVNVHSAEFPQGAVRGQLGK
jgi:hypothetical protein